VTDCQMRHLNGLDFLAQSRVIWPDNPGHHLFGDTVYE
jgi:hypothetical protein